MTSAQETSAYPRDARGDRFARGVLRALWSGVLPALAAGLVIHDALPTSWQARDGAAAALLRAGHAHPVALWALLFLVFAAIATYWARFLPGGRYLGELPLALAGRFSGRAGLAANRAATLRRAALRSLGRARSRTVADAEHADGLQRAVDQLELALRSADGDLLGATGPAEVVCASELRRAAVLRTGALIGAVAIAAVAALLVRAMCFQAAEVKGTSMLPTLEPGDLLVVNRSAYGWRLPNAAKAPPRMPHRGDLVIVDNPHPGEGEPTIVKRVMGLPGDRITMQGNVPVINGWSVPGCDAGYYLHASHNAGAQGRAFVEFVDDNAYLALYSPSVPPYHETYVVGPGEVFLLGDNRASSSDSRAWNDGKGTGVPLSTLVGRVSRLFASAHLDGQVDWRQLLKPVELRPHFPELDLHELRDGITSCLQQRPSGTSPPTWEAPAASVAASPPAEASHEP